MPLEIRRTYRILGSRHEVMFRDGSAIGLHQVMGDDGKPELYLRALRSTDATAWVVFDLRHVMLSEIEADLARVSESDRPGCVFYTLRQAFKGAEGALQAIKAQAIAEQPVAWSTEAA